MACKRSQVRGDGMIKKDIFHNVYDSIWNKNRRFASQGRRITLSNILVKATGIDWQTYWTKITCKSPFEAGVYFLNQLENEFAWGTWGRVEISKDIQSYQNWQPDHEYNVGDMVIGTDQNIYACEIDHTSTINDCPTTGSNWDDYWVLAECSG